MSDTPQYQDYWRVFASQLYDIPYDNVTPDLRREVKSIFWMFPYMGSQSKMKIFNAAKEFERSSKQVEDLQKQIKEYFNENTGNPGGNDCPHPE